MISRDAAQFTKILLPALPDLLHKFLLDANKIAPLLEIPLHFRLKEIRQNRNEDSVKQLLDALFDIIEHGCSRDDVTEAAGKCVAFFGAEESLSFTEIYVREAAEHVWQEFYTCFELLSETQTEVGKA